MRTHVRNHRHRSSHWAQRLAEVAQQDAQYKKHWRIGNARFLVDFAQQRTAEQAEEDEQHDKGTVLVMLSALGSILVGLASQCTHDIAITLILIKSYQKGSDSLKLSFSLESVTGVLRQQQLYLGEIGVQLVEYVMGIVSLAVVEGLAERVW